jgi:hypothetical protein
MSKKHKQAVHNNTTESAQLGADTMPTRDMRLDHILIKMAVHAQVAINEATTQIEAIRKAQQVPEKTKIRVYMLDVFKSQNGDLDVFLSWAESEETYIKSDGAGEMKVDSLPRCWVQAKSDIKNGVNKHGLNPASFETDSEYQIALNSARKAAKESSTAGATPVTADTQLNSRLSALAGLFEMAPETTQDEIISYLDELIENVREVAKGLGVDEITESPEELEDAEDVDAELARELQASL